MSFNDFKVPSPLPSSLPLTMPNPKAPCAYPMITNFSSNNNKPCPSYLPLKNRNKNNRIKFGTKKQLPADQS